MENLKNSAHDGLSGADGSVNATNNSDKSYDFSLVSANGEVLNFGSIASGESKHFLLEDLKGINGTAIKITADSAELCDLLTDYQDFYTAISFQVNPETGECELAGGIRIIDIKAYPGVGNEPGDVSVVNNSRETFYYILVARTDSGLVGFYYKDVDSNTAQHFKASDLSTINGLDIWLEVSYPKKYVQPLSWLICKGLTNYKTDYAPITFQTNPSNSDCELS